jgi:uncharacterized membrane protein
LILQVSPESSWLIREGAASILLLHVTAGTVGVLSGAAALFFRKGQPLHRAAGSAFFVSMLTMSAIGACVAPFLPSPQWGSAVGGVLTFYLVATAWATVRRKEGSVGLFEAGALLVALGAGATDLMFGLQAARSPTGLFEGVPALPHYIFAGVAALAVAGDLRMILRHGVFGAQRIARHLWRMCVALFIATASLFLGQQQVFPEFVRGSPILYVPVIAVLGLMIFWLLRVGVTNRFKRDTTGQKRLRSPRFAQAHEHA